MCLCVRFLFIFLFIFQPPRFPFPISLAVPGSRHAGQAKQLELRWPHGDGRRQARALPPALSAGAMAAGPAASGATLGLH